MNTHVSKCKNDKIKIRSSCLRLSGNSPVFAVAFEDVVPDKNIGGAILSLFMLFTAFFSHFLNF
jgi:hypothetical protein